MKTDEIHLNKLEKETIINEIPMEVKSMNKTVKFLEHKGKTIIIVLILYYILFIIGLLCLIKNGITINAMTIWVKEYYIAIILAVALRIIIKHTKVSDILYRSIYKNIAIDEQVNIKDNKWKTVKVYKEIAMMLITIILWIVVPTIFIYLNLSDFLTTFSYSFLVVSIFYTYTPAIMFSYFLFNKDIKLNDNLIVPPKSFIVTHCKEKHFLLYFNENDELK